MGMLVCAILFANPFPLQNFAYQYDCLPMAMSVFFASVTACYSPKNRVIGVLLSSVLIFLSLLLYQASIVISGCLYLCVIYRRLSKNESIPEIIKDALCLLLSSFIAIASYFLLFVASSSSILKRSEIAGFMRTRENLLFLHEKLHELYSGSGYLFLIIAFSVLLSLVVIAMRRRFLHALLFTVLFLLLAATSIMPSVILDEGFVGPRVLMSIATLLLFSSLVITGRVANITFIFAAGVLVLHSTVMSYAFSGDLRAQLKRYQTLSSLVINETQSKEGMKYEKVYIHCASSISREENVFVRFNQFISWLNPEEAWAIRFFIRNSGEDRIVSDWGDCGEADFSRGDKGNNYYSRYAKDNNLHFIMK
nr:glucosyltransferase domain-containing protein [Winslowiella iniecta]